MSHDGSAPVISVVVCTHNGEGTIRDTLRALTSQNFAGEMEIIVVDDGSTDLTSEVVRKFPVRLISSPTNVGLSAARNLGIEASLAPLVAFTDDDCIPPPGWVANLVTEWAKLNGDIQALGGTVQSHATDTFNRRFNQFHHTLAPASLRLSGAGFLLRLWLYLRNEGIVISSDSPQPVFVLVGANMSFRRDALKEIGGFDVRRRFGGDEIPVCAAIQQRWGQESVWCSPSIVMHHNFDPKLRDTFRRAYAYGRGSGRDFAEQGGIPSVGPIGLLVMAAGAGAICFKFLGIRSWWLLLACAMLAPYMIAARPTSSSSKARWTEKPLFRLVIALEEISGIIGFVGGWLRSKETK